MNVAPFMIVRVKRGSGSTADAISGLVGSDTLAPGIPFDQHVWFGALFDEHMNSFDINGIDKSRFVLHFNGYITAKP